jgi:transposase
MDRWCYPRKRWLRRHPRFRQHFTPTYSSWINMVERWFAKLTEEALRRGRHQNTRELREASSGKPLRAASSSK